MPIEWGWSFRWKRPPTCKRKISWSMMRGGCRFAPNHAGACKPAKSGQRV